MTVLRISVPRVKRTQLLACGVIAALLAACSRATPPGTLVFVGNEGSSDVSVVDAYGYRELERIPMPAPPRGMAVSPEGHRVYVALSDDRIAVIDVASRRVLSRQDAGDVAQHPRMDSTLLANGPVGVAASRDGKLVYRADSTANKVAIVSADSAREVATIRVGERPRGIALSFDSRLAFTANAGSNDVSVVDLRARREITRIKVGERPWGVAVAQPQATR